MHKHLVPIVVIAAIMALIFIPGVFDTLFALFFVGIIPNTDYTIPAPVMMTIDAVLLAIAVYAVSRQLITAADPIERDIQRRNKARKKVLRQTAVRTQPAPDRPKKRYQPVTEH